MLNHHMIDTVVLRAEVPTPGMVLSAWEEAPGYLALFLLTNDAINPAHPIVVLQKCVHGYLGQLEKYLPDI